jgi:uncharacterized repeat protein (TIGR02543 family)
MLKKITTALLVALVSTVFAVSAAASPIPPRGSTTIVPNRLTVRWEDESHAPRTIDTFRIFGFNVAQLRNMVSILNGTVSDRRDGSWQIHASGTPVPFRAISFHHQREIDYIINHTPIRNHAGTLIYPNQPGWVFLPDYEYNWASVRDVINAMNLELIDVIDDPEAGHTEVIVRMIRPSPTPEPGPPVPPPGRPITRPDRPGLTLSVSPSALRVSDTSLVAEAIVSGTAGGPITFDRGNLPGAVELRPDGNIITVTARPLRAGEAPVNDTFNVTVIRDGIRAPITVQVNLGQNYALITYDLSGGVAHPENPGQTEVRIGQLLPRPGDPTCPNGRVFVGWFADAARNYPFNFDQPIEEYNVGLFAGWTDAAAPGPHVVTFDADGVITTQTVAHEGLATRPADPPRAGYTFDGWFDIAGDEWNFATPVTAPITLSAKWTRIPPVYHTVTFVGGNVPPQAVRHNGLVTRPADPPRAGYTFVGWFDETGNPWNFAAPVVGNMTLTATWEVTPIVHTVAFINEGEIVTQPVVHGEQVGRPYPDPTRAGYTFDGWFTAAGVPWNFGNPVNGNMTLTARWTAIVDPDIDDLRELRLRFVEDDIWTPNSLEVYADELARYLAATDAVLAAYPNVTQAEIDAAYEGLSRLYNELLVPLGILPELLESVHNYLVDNGMPQRTWFTEVYTSYDLALDIVNEIVDGNNIVFARNCVCDPESIVCVCDSVPGTIANMKRVLLLIELIDLYEEVHYILADLDWRPAEFDEPELAMLYGVYDYVFDILSYTFPHTGQQFVTAHTLLSIALDRFQSA